MSERVWDRFLTDRDRAYRAATPDYRVGFGTRPGLLLIDLYRSVFGDKPEPLLEAIKTWPGSFGLAGWDALPQIQELLRVARDVGIPVIHITGLDIVGVPGPYEAAHREFQRPLDLASRVRPHHRFEIVDQLTPLPGEAVLRKSAPSAFLGTPLLGQLNYLDVDTLIVAGQATSGCVRASVVDGCSYRFRMIVVEDCVFDRQEAAHAVNLFDMHQKYADVVLSTEVIAYMQGWQAENPQRVTV